MTHRELICHQIFRPLRSQVRKLFVSASMSPFYLAQPKYTLARRNQLTSTGAQRTATNKVSSSLAFSLRVCTSLCCVCVRVWLALSHRCPSGCTARAMKTGLCVSVVGVRVKTACTCLYAHVCLIASTYWCVCACLFVPWSCPDLSTLLRWLKTVTASNHESFQRFVLLK